MEYLKARLIPCEVWKLPWKFPEACSVKGRWMCSVRCLALDFLHDILCLSVSESNRQLPETGKFTNDRVWFPLITAMPLFYSNSNIEYANYINTPSNPS